VKIIYKSFCPFPITLALCALAGGIPTPSTFDARLFAQAAQIFNYSNTKDSNTNFLISCLRALRGEQNKLNATHVPHKGRNPNYFFDFLRGSL